MKVRATKTVECITHMLTKGGEYELEDHVAQPLLEDGTVVRIDEDPETAVEKRTTKTLTTRTAPIK